MALSEDQKKKRIAEAQRTLGKASSSRHQPAVFDFASTTQNVPRSLESMYANPSIDVYAFASSSGLGSEQGPASPPGQDEYRERLERESDELLNQISRVSTDAAKTTEPEQAVSQQDSYEVQPEQIEGMIDKAIGLDPGHVDRSMASKSILPQKADTPSPAVFEASTTASAPASSPDPSEEPLFGPSDVPMAKQSVEPPVTAETIAERPEAPKTGRASRSPRSPQSSGSVWPPAAPGSQGGESPIRGGAQPVSDWNEQMPSMASQYRQRPTDGDSDLSSVEQVGGNFMNTLVTVMQRLAAMSVNAQQRLDDIEQSLEGGYDLDEFEGG
jgi:hypothetical protein